MGGTMTPVKARAASSREHCVQGSESAFSGGTNSYPGPLSEGLASFPLDGKALREYPQRALCLRKIRKDLLALSWPRLGEEEWTRARRMGRNFNSVSPSFLTLLERRGTLHGRGT